MSFGGAAGIGTAVSLRSINALFSADAQNGLYFANLTMPILAVTPAIYRRVGTAVPAWRNHGVFCDLPFQRGRGSGSMLWLAGITFLALVSGAQAQFREERSVAWRTFEVPDLGTRIQYPAGIFNLASKAEKGSGQRFERADGRAVLSIYSRPNEAGETPTTYLRDHLRMDRSALDYARITRSFFAISWERDGVILYSRCNFSGGARGAIHCFDLEYPQEEKRSWDSIVTRISLSLRPLES
jgi:hypothetical protein